MRENVTNPSGSGQRHAGRPGTILQNVEQPLAADAAETVPSGAKVRQEGEAVYARLGMDAGVLLAVAGKSDGIKDVQVAPRCLRAPGKRSRRS